MERIDVHTHCFPETFLREVAAAYPDRVQTVEPAEGRPMMAIWSGAPLPAWDEERRCGEMDRDGVRLEILSAPTVYTAVDARTAELCQRINDAHARVADRQPGRFRFFVHLPVHDAVEARKEFERWLGSDAVVGVTLPSNLGGIYPGDRSLTPIWEWFHDAGLPVFIHPVKPCGIRSPLIPVVVDFPHDTATAGASIVYAGLFDRYPGLKVILSHYGGALGSLARRLDIVDHPHFPRTVSAELVRTPSEYVGEFYVDTAQGFHRPAFECARATFGLGHLIYGSDHFFHDSPWRPELNRFLDSLMLRFDEREAILHGNAEQLLP